MVSMTAMKAALDQAWAQEVCAYCDPVFEAAEVGFVVSSQRLEMEEQR